MDRSRCNCRLLPWSVLPSPYSGRVGVHNFPFEACSGFTHVTARRVAQPPKAAFVAGLRYGQLPNRTACQLPGQTDHCPGGTYIHKVIAPSGAHRRARRTTESHGAVRHNRPVAEVQQFSFWRSRRRSPASSWCAKGRHPRFWRPGTDKDVDGAPSRTMTAGMVRLRAP